MLQHFDSLLQLVNAIPDEQAAIDHFTAIRWKRTAFCPYCNSTKIYHFSDKRTHKCGDCKQRFSIKVGTIFEDTKIPLRKWFMAIWSITSNRKGVASTQLARDIGVTQKTAWFMLHRLRHAIRTQSFNRPLDGDIEADETFIGGKERNKHAAKRGKDKKAIVLGMLERGGELRTTEIENLRMNVLRRPIWQNVADESNVITDDHKSYVGLDRRYHHHSVNHSAGEYVRDHDIHTNGIESVWALFKRQIVGTHHWLSKKHLSRYLGEMTWRFNLREMAEGSRVNALLAQTAGRLTYKALTT